MSKRGHISMEVKLAAAHLALGDIPYEHAKLMSAKQINSLYQYDHNILHAIKPIDEPWNLSPSLIAAHRKKSRKDTSIVAKSKRLDKAHREFQERFLLRTSPAPPKPSRLRGGGFRKHATLKRTVSGKVVSR